jgi:hypothetical protein
MPDRKNDAQPRPVDALFGDSGAVNAPTYVVESPQAVTTVSPPALDAFPEPVAMNARETSEPEVPASAAPASVPDENVMPLPMPPSAETASASEAPPLLLDSDDALFSMSAPRTRERFIADLPYRIERLYDDIKMDLPDSPALAAVCMEMLRDAREAYLRRDYANAEFLAQSVDARLKRSVKSLRAARSPMVLGLWAWELVMLIAFGALLAITYVANLTLFGLPVAGELIVLFRALAWGGVGGVLGAMYNLPWFIQYRDYDPAFNVNYIVRPLFGSLIGAVMFLLAQAFSFAGVVASPTVKPGELTAGAVLLNLVAVFTGFKQEYVAEFFDGLLRAIFRKPQAPRGK